LWTRLEQCRAEGTLETLGDGLSTETRDAAQEAGGWLLPIDDRRAEGSARAGLLPGFTLSCYLRLVDWTSRLVREGKARMPAELESIFVRIRVDPEPWGEMVSALFARSQRTGCHFGTTEHLAAAARAHGRRWHRNQVRRVVSARASAA
jgi:hypothetical protein